MADELAPPLAPLWVGGHPAMDLLNTVLQQQGQTVDVLENDHDVLAWLEHAGLLPEPAPADLPASHLLRAARRLRETLRAIAVARTTGTPPDLAPFNRLLAATGRTAELHLRSDDTIERHERITGRLPERLLTPLAVAAADLLSTALPHQIRRCEGAGCVLWFFDDTPSQRRRWCSMELCGNRAKVAAFRARHP